ncbi:MAG: alpha-L-rhamnosidase C-terminal domain-containing protein [Verrucomicrobiota bacterium]
MNPEDPSRRPILITILIPIVILLSGFAACAQSLWDTSPIKEPYPAMSSRGFCGPAVPLSPDPLVSYRWPKPKASDGLQVYLQRPEKVTADAATAFDNLQSLTGKMPNVTVNGTGSIQMDFGRESAAWLEFDSPDLTGDVEMSVSEYNRPMITQRGGATSVKTLKPVKYGHTYRLELNKLLYEGVRFGWIHVKSFTSAWHITGIRLVCQTKPTNYDGSFACSDPMLTRIWYTGAYSVKLNLLSDEFGAILVDRGDRGSFTGDAHASQAASLVAFGNYDFVKQNIDRTKGTAQGIIGYNLYWVLSVVDYYKYTGDAAAVDGYIEMAVHNLEEAYQVYGKNPSLVFIGWDERTGGFEQPSCPESQRAYKMLAIRTWVEFASLMGAVGKRDLQNKYNGYASEKIAELRKNPTWHTEFTLHSAADALNTGLLNDGEKNAIFGKELSNRVNRLSLSPFNQYFILQAFARIDKFDDALNTIDDIWGGQIRYGATTFFEVYRPSWNQVIGINDPIPNAQCGHSSLCHPWSSGVTKWLSEEILGIKPMSGGFKSYQILPHLGRTLTDVSGKTPTPLGGIAASFNVNTGHCAFSAPQGTIGKVGIPKVEKTIGRIIINGQLAWDGSFHAVPGIAGANEDAAFINFSGVQPGDYTAEVSYKGKTPTYQPPVETYAARFVKQDTTTSGNWGGVYGKDGYLLCHAAGNDKTLPSYVSSVGFKLNRGGPNGAVWASRVNDPRALAPDRKNSFPRDATCVATTKQEGTFNTMTLTIHSKGTREYQVALYFLDWDGKGEAVRRAAVEMFDAETLDMIAPVQVVSDFQNGKYLVYTYNKPAIFRIDHVWGDNAVISGVFFDTPPATDKDRAIQR